MLKPFAHQKQTIKFLDEHPEVYDASDPGTGKTYGEVVDFSKRRKKKGGCALVLAPKSLLEAAWKSDFRKFAPDMKVSVAYASNREKAFSVDADVYVTNVDAVVWLAKQKKKFFDKFDTLIIDEGTCYKHHTSARSKSAAKIAPYFKYRRILSGTPNPNGVCDLWHQYYILDGGKRLGKSFYSFRNATCIPTKVGASEHALRWDDKPGIENIVGALVKDITIRHVFEECVDIPPNHRYAVEFELSSKHYAQYNELEAFSIAQLKSNKSVTATNGAVLYGKLLQVASGAVYDDQGGYSTIDSGRYELIMDLIDERKHSIVFFNWEHQLKELSKLADKHSYNYAVIDGKTKDTERVKIVQAYQAGAYKTLFAHPQSAGHGLTLTKGTATIFASPTHNLEHFLQGLKRVYRISQTEKTETIVVVAKGTIDEHVWLKCQDKNMKLNDLLSELVQERRAA